MAERMDLMTPREYESSGQTKTSWTKVGVAFKSKNGSGWNLQFDAFPLNGKVVMMEPRERDDSQRSQKTQRRPARTENPSRPAKDEGPWDDTEMPF